MIKVDGKKVGREREREGEKEKKCNTSYISLLFVLPPVLPEGEWVRTKSAIEGGSITKGSDSGSQDREDLE